jgi:hypothetical protein
MSAGPLWTLLFICLILMLRKAGSVAERRLRDNTRVLWRQALAGHVTLPHRMTAIRALRTSKPYQEAVRFLKWQVVPFILGIMMISALAMLVWSLWQRPDLILGL